MLRYVHWLSRTVLAVAVLFATAGAGLAVDSPTGDPERGRALYVQCIGCHSLDRNRTGPKHCGVVGRASARVPGYRYLPAMQAANVVWDQATLDAFLRDPIAFVPGTTMGYAGIARERDRRDLIAWLSAAADDCHASAAAEQDTLNSTISRD